MKENEAAETLRLLDRERQTVCYPGVSRHCEPGVVKDVSDDGAAIEVVYSSNSADAIDGVIAAQIEAARRAGAELEWKLFGHDWPSDLADRLMAAGFEAGAREAFLVLAANAGALESFGDHGDTVRRIVHPDDMNDVRTIIEEVAGRNCDRQIEQYVGMLRRHPENMSVYVAYAEGEPAACGRIYFHPESRFGALYGGNTRERFRNRGLFTQVVAARIREAITRGVAYVCVDALPTSEPILRKRGFTALTYTQPFNWKPASG